jgi:hypothetical protein
MNVLGRYSLLSLFVLPAALGAAGAAIAADKVLGLYGDWGAQTFSEGKNTGCSMWSQPTKGEGKYKTRGAVIAYIILQRSEIPHKLDDFKPEGSFV